MNILIKKNLLIYKGYKLKCSVGKSGLTNSKKEGDFSTPKGLFGLGLLYYRKDRINLTNCKIKKVIIKKSMGWCDDAKSKNYNKEVKIPFKYSAAKLYIKRKAYDIFIIIKYNSKPILKGRGSGIFLHLCNKKYKPTKGCVAIVKEDLLKILPLINKKTNILIK